MVRKKFENYGLIVRHTARRFTRVLQDGISPYGITAGEFRVLRTLEDGPLMQSAIAQLAAMDRPFVAALIKKLAAKGLVTGRRHSTDRRRVDVVVSPRGVQMLSAITEEIIVKSNTVALRGISALELRTFTDVCRRMAANLDATYFTETGSAG